MRGDDVFEIVAVEIGVHRIAVLELGLVIFRARQRRQAEELQNIQRQFVLDDGDVFGDALRGVVREAEDVAGIGQDAGILPRQQHLAIFGDLVLPLVGRCETLRIDALQPEKHPRDAGRLGLVDEAVDLVTQRVDLDHQLDVLAAGLRDLAAQLGEPIEDLLPILVAGEIVVGHEEPEHALREIFAHQPFDVVGAAAARLAALHVDDGAERALIGTAAPGVERGLQLVGPLQELLRQDRRRRAFQRRQIVEVVVERLQRAAGGIAQQSVAAAFEFAGIQRDAEIERLLHVGLNAGQHRQTARDVEAADRDRHAGGA